MEFERIIQLVAFVAVLSIMSGILYTVQEGAEEQSLHNLCKASVQANSAAKLGGRVDAFKNQVQCPPEELAIEAPLDVNYGRERAKRQIAEEMVDCWDKFWQGEVELFEGEGVYCSVCNWVSFIQSGTLQDMNNYLATTKMQGTDKTYMDYLTRREDPQFQDYYKRDNLFVASDPIYDDVIDSSQLHSIVFVYAKGESSMVDLQRALLSPDSSILAGAVVGAGGAYAAISSVGAVVGPTLARFLGGPVTLAVAGVAGGAAGSVLSTVTLTQPQHLAMTVLVPHNEESLQALGCQQFTITKRNS